MGKGIGPVLEAKDILAVFQNEKDAPIDLKTKAIAIAATILEFGGNVASGEGVKIATQILESGLAFKKFLTICEAQGGFHEPGDLANYTHDIVSTRNGIVTEVDNRNLAMIAKLAGAPHDKAAGIEFYSRLGTSVQVGQPLYRIFAESKGELTYALNYAQSLPNIVKIRDLP